MNTTTTYERQTNYPKIDHWLDAHGWLDERTKARLRPRRYPHYRMVLTSRVCQSLTHPRQRRGPHASAPSVINIHGTVPSVRPSIYGPVRAESL